MKAIVANALFGGIFGCLNWANSALAIPPTKQIPRSPFNDRTPVISANLPNLAIEPDLFGSFNHITLERQGKLKAAGSLVGDLLPSDKVPYIHQTEQNVLILGFQNAFWSNSNGGKYWGITTVERWGNSDRQLKLSKLNYTNSAPILDTGSSSLTFSGGGKRNLTPKAKLARDRYSSSEFEEFRGGITYHHGIGSQITMGVGFIYENKVAGFTQLVYDSDILPIKTTISLLAKDSTVNLHSHVRFQPADNFALNYYHDAEKQKFDLNWQVAPAFTLVGKGNSKSESYSAGIKVAMRNDFLSLTATAQLDNERNLQWELNSQIGSLQLVYKNTQRERSSELNAKLFESSQLGLQCTTFIEYQSKLKKARESEEFIVWGGKLQSTRIVANNKPLWSLDLGRGLGVNGRGLVIDGAVALRSNLFLKLKYQTISAVSDDTKVKLQLSSD